MRKQGATKKDEVLGRRHDHSCCSSAVCLPHVDPARNFTLSPLGPAGFLRQHAIPFLSVSRQPLLSSCLPGSAGGGTDRLQRRGTAAANLRLRCGPPPAVGGGAAAAVVVHRADAAPRQLLPRARRLVQRHCVVRPAQQQQQSSGRCCQSRRPGQATGQQAVSLAAGPAAQTAVVAEVQHVNADCCRRYATVPK